MPHINPRSVKTVITVILLCSCIGLRAQKATGYSAVGRIMSHIPDSLTYSSKGIADYVYSHFHTQKDKARGIFIWIVRNIQYDFDIIFDINYYPDPAELIEKVLKTRTGVCLHYANLFSDIANKAGIKSYVVQGYTKQHGVVDFLPHVWCAGLIDTVWYLFDPTWGSGYVMNGTFVKDLNNAYFMASPKDLIISHMPFDPLWQFLHFPVTNQEFYARRSRINTGKPFFSFTDTLYTYEHESEIERYISSARRIEQNGVTNAFLAAKLRVLQGEIVYYRNKMNVEKYDTAVKLYNEGIKILNRFIKYSNHQYKPEKDSVQTTQILDSAECLLKKAVETLNGIKDQLENATIAITELNNSIKGTMKLLSDQRILLYRYFKSRR